MVKSQKRVGALQNCLLLSMLSLAVLGGSTADPYVDFKVDVRPPYRNSEDHILMFPMIKKDYANWGSKGSAVFLQNKAVIAPEASSLKGLIHTTEPNPFRDHWYALLDFNIGRDKVKEMNKSGEGFSIYYLRNFDAGNPDINENFYGFVDDFDGLGIFINTMASDKKSKQDKVKKVQVASFANDGKKMNKQTNKRNQCYHELTGSHLQFSKIAIEYEKPMLQVSVFDHEAQAMVHCFTQDIELDYDGFFVISASSGSVFPQYNFVNSFDLLDPKTPQTSHHQEDSHQRKAEHEHYAESIAATVSDLIHTGAHEMGEDFEDMTADELMEIIAEQTFYMHHEFDYTNQLLHQMAGHFQTISSIVLDEELYDHSVALNQDLF